MKVMVKQTVTWVFETDKYSIADLRKDQEEGGCLAMDLAREADGVVSETVRRVKE